MQNISLKNKFLFLTLLFIASTNQALAMTSLPQKLVTLKGSLSTLKTKLTTLSDKLGELKSRLGGEQVEKIIVLDEKTNFTDGKEALFDPKSHGDSWYDDLEVKDSWAMLNIISDLNQCNKLEIKNQFSHDQLLYQYIKGAGYGTKPNVKFIQLSISPTSNNKKLKEISLTGNTDYPALFFENLESLEKINVNACKNLTKLHITNCPKIKALDLSNCGQLETLSLYGLNSIKELDLSNCGQLNTLYLTNLNSIKELDLSLCGKLTSLDLQEMNMIEKLTLPKNPSQKITITTLDCPKLPDDTIVNLPNTFTVNHSATK